ncbi:MAG: M67 family metallopeptidase [Actinomycetota bacterium]
MLTLSTELQLELIAHCIRSLPEEGCGLLIGDYETGVVARVVSAENIAHSAMIYTVDPKTFLSADREASKDGLDVIGVFHSHTHTEAYPSPTDVAQAPDPGWHYVLVSLRDTHPVLRSYRIENGQISEEPVRPG